MKKVPVVYNYKGLLIHLGVLHEVYVWDEAVDRQFAALAISS